MPTDRVIVEILTAANMSGLNEAKAGFLGMTNQLTALTAGIGIAALAGKSMIDITEKHDAAEQSLAQAIATHGGSLGYANEWLSTFIDTNRAYIPEQAAVIQGYADLTRSGLSQVETQKDLNRAIDLAALKHISLESAVQLLIAAEHGRTRGLIDLGITTTKYTDAQGNVINQGKNMALVMQEIDQKTAKGRETTLATTQATNKLSNEWQDMASITGPPLVSALDMILTYTDDILRSLKALGENKQWADAVSAGFGLIQKEVVQVVDDVKALIKGVQWLGDHAPNLGSSATGGQRARPGSAIPAASGFEGIVSSPTYFLAGEGGAKEHVSIGPAGGGSGSIVQHFHFEAPVYADGPGIDRLANAIAQRLAYATGR